MADNLFSVGTRLSADEYLKIISFMNKREMDDNRLIRGLGTLTGVSTTDLPSSGLETTLRRYSTANDEEITGKIIYGMADGDYKTEKEYVREYKKRNYPPLFMEKALAEWRRTMGRKESAASAGYSKATAAQARKMEPGIYTRQQQAITKEEQRIIDEDMVKSMSIVALNAARDDIKAIQGGAKYYATVQDRIVKETDGWTKTNLDYYKSLMDESGLEPSKDKETTKAVYDTRNAEQRWMTEDDIQALNKANPGTILPAAEQPADEQQVSMAMLSAASQVLYDELVLTKAGITQEEARPLLQKWASDKSWLSAFDVILEGERVLHQEWYKAYEGVMDRWYTTTTTGNVIGG
jgi:hypothetical protein